MNKIALLFALALFWYSPAFSQTISTSALASSSFCQNEDFTVDYTITGTFTAGNVFTAELSDATGSFASPVSIGSVTSTTAGTINATMPNLMTTGALYRVRVVASTPAVTGTDNGTDLTVTGSTVSPTTYGSNQWNVYCYNIATYTNNVNAFDLSNYRGMYTDANVSFQSTDFWGETAQPSDAAGYVGCPISNDLHIVQYKREGFPCGYYQINVAGPSGQRGFDDAAKLIVDGTTVWSNAGCCQTINNAWTGALGPTSQVEMIWSENGGRSYGRLTFVEQDYPALTPDVTICAGSSTTLTASGASNYDWTTNTTHLVAPYNVASVVCSPPGGTASGTETYTVSTTDATTGCLLSNSVNVTIDPLPSTSVTPTTGAYCASGTVDVIASGANTYTYSPMTDVTLNSASGHDATLSPSATTTYTVTGSNNCATSTASVTVTVTLPVGNPAVFGSNTWNVYGYAGNNFDTYMGFYVHNTLDFDTRTLWGNNSSPSNAPGYSGCTIANDQHSFVYKREGFPCGYYQLDIPNHDDIIELIIDGVSVFSQNFWFQNVYKANIWQGYLDQNSTIEYTVREFGGGSNGGLAFIYLFGPTNGVTETVWHGDVSTDWFDPANWCNGVPSATIGALIPAGRPNMPVINGVGAIAESIDIKSGASLEISGSNGLEVRGDWINDGTFTANTSTVTFAGSGTDTISGTATHAFHNMTINKGVVTNALTLQDDVSVAGTLTLTQGICNADSAMLQLNNGATVSGVSNNSHVEGFFRKVGNVAFTFPVGDGGAYRPISISAPGSTADHFTASYYQQSPDAATPTAYTTTSLGAGIDHVSTCEYWILDRTNGSSNVEVTLTWAGTSCGVTNLSELLVARWDGAQWTDEGNGGTTGNTTSGDIVSSGAVTTFSPFTLASSTPSNPLPVELVYFDAVPTSTNQVVVDWVTASEVNSEVFFVERSVDAVTWERIGEVPAAGWSLETLNYQLIDPEPYAGVSYYRLEERDFDGSTMRSHIVAVEIAKGTALSAHPNPANDVVTITGFEGALIDLRLVDQIGAEVSNSIRKVSQSDGIITFDVSALPKGIYTFIVNGQTVQFVKR